MTTEIFRNAVFEDPERFRDTDFIFDEVHFVDDVDRGTVWEESLIFAPEHVRFVGLSATIANLHEFGAWIREVRDQDLTVIEHKKRPVPLSHRLFHQDAGVFQLAQRSRAITFHDRDQRVSKRERQRAKWGDKRERAREAPPLRSEAVRDAPR